MHNHNARYLVTLIVVLAIAAIVSRWYGGSREVAVDFSLYTAGPQRKAAFLAYFLPIIQRQNEEIMQDRERLLVLQARSFSLSDQEKKWVADIAREFGLDAFDIGDPSSWSVLVDRVDMIPPSLALVQGANESAWGTSRFARDGYNYFGQWCFTTGCGLVPTRRDTGALHEVAVFDSPVKSVERYIHNLNTHRAYRSLRDIRRSLRSESQVLTGEKLADGLGNYSARGTAYIDELKQMMRHNKLEELNPMPVHE